MAEPEKKCPKCQEKVKLLASVCKHCGYEFTPAELESSRKLSRTSNSVAVGCVSVVVLVLLVALCGKPASQTSPGHTSTEATSGDDSSSASKGGAYADEGKQYAWISAGEEQIKTQLKDPESATFRNVHFYSGGGIPVACGEVNAKNGFGGYSGFERFVAAGTTIAVTESMVEGGIEEVWDKYCVRAPTDEAHE